MLGTRAARICANKNQNKVISGLPSLRMSAAFRGQCGFSLAVAMLARMPPPLSPSTTGADADTKGTRNGKKQPKDMIKDSHF